MGAGRQDPFGVETELLPYLILTWFPNEIECVLITKALSGMPGHEILFSKRSMPLTLLILVLGLS